ncbi:sensor histidine kinase [Dankookia rubra]|nr:HWE histidine kinase domain-containing protein [Dankookia rubra]
MPQDPGLPAGQAQRRGGDLRDDELEQATVAAEDAREETAVLTLERDAVVAELRAMRAVLAEERARHTRRDAVANVVRQRFEAAVSELSKRRLGSQVAEEELRVALEELQVTGEQLAEANVALAQANERLEQEVAERTAELAATNAALRGSERRLRMIIESATDYAIFTIDQEGRVTSWNPGAEQLFGQSEAEVLGRTTDTMFIPDDRAAGLPELEMRQAGAHGRAEDDRWHVRADGTRFFVNGAMMPLRDEEGQLQGFLKILRDRTAPRAEEERRRVQLEEMTHRIKNTLTVVQTVAVQTQRHAATPDAFRRTFGARLAALARSHDLLMRGGWEGASLREIVERTMDPYIAGNEAERVTIDGLPLLLTPAAALSLNLAFHELATNATKYGALSGSEGEVEIRWTVDRTDHNAAVVDITWRERGGPPVHPPESRGFGSRLVEQALAQEFGAEVRLDFAREGVACRIRLPFTVGVVAQ